MNDEVNAYAKGVLGEAAACDWLLKRGMELLARRFHSPFGEIDLVMLDGETLVFVEVKARGSGGAALAQAAVTPAKRRRIVETARCFLAQHPQHAARAVRFDVMTVAQDGVRHIPDAFWGSEW